MVMVAAASKAQGGRSAASGSPRRASRGAGALLLAAVAVTALAVLAHAAQAATEAAVDTGQVVVALRDNALMYYSGTSSTDPPPPCNNDLVPIIVRYHMAGGGADCELFIGDLWGLGYTDGSGVFHDATCWPYGGGRDGLCGPFLSPQATWTPVPGAFTVTPPTAKTTATQIVAADRWQANPGGGTPLLPLEVVHDMKFSPDPHFVKVDVTVTNHGTSTATGLHYRRVDAFQDNLPAPPATYGTGQVAFGTYTRLWLEGSQPNAPSTVVCTSNSGWAEGAPFTSCTLPEWQSNSQTAHCGDTGAHVPAPIPGPTAGQPWVTFTPGYRACSQGAAFEIALGDLPAGQSRSFTMYIGGILNGYPAAHAAMLALGADFWAIAEPGTSSNTTWPTSVVGYQGLIPPTAAFTWTTPTPGWSSLIPAPYTAGQTVCLGNAAAFSATATAGSNPIASYSWNFGDAGTGSGAGPSHTYAAVGTYTVTLTVMDTRGWPATSTQTLTVMDCHVPPVAQAALAGGGSDCIDNRVHFFADGSYDPDGGPIANVTWDFGDGAMGWGNPATHQYEVDAHVTITLTVTDDDGQTGTATIAYPAPGDPDCPPVLDDIPDQHAQPGDEVVFRLHARDPDGPTLRVLMVRGPLGQLDVPAGTFTADGTFAFQVGDWAPGWYLAVFRASDGTAYDEKVARVQVGGGHGPGDSDHDGIPDVADNCPNMPNHDQADTDGDGVGDACQAMPPNGADPAAASTLRVTLADADRDGVPDRLDDCPAVPDHDQADLDGDGVGDACDPDMDGDGVPNALDDCLRVPDPLQADADHDGVGDACAAHAATPWPLGVPSAPSSSQGNRAASVAVATAAGLAFAAALTLVLTLFALVLRRRRP